MKVLHAVAMIALGCALIWCAMYGVKQHSENSWNRESRLLKECDEGRVKFYEECLTENKLYLCDVMWAQVGGRVHVFDPRYTGMSGMSVQCPDEVR